MSGILNKIYQLQQSNIDCKLILEDLEKNNKFSNKELKSFISLKLREFIKNNIHDKIEYIIFTEKLMHRDYWACIEYYYSKENLDKAKSIMINFIKTIDDIDIDIMIKNKWYNLIKEWDGYPVETILNSNTFDYSKLKVYKYDITKMIDIYENKIIPYIRKSFDNIINECDILIDGANISHYGKSFNFNILIKVIKLIEKLNLKPKIILHERHVITNKLLDKYIIRVPRNNYDDNFLLYGMLKYNKKVVSNDLFRDHVIGMDNMIKCHINYMTIKYIDNMLIIPQYSRCIQIIDEMIFIPSKNGNMVQII